MQFVGGWFSGREELFAICWNHRRRRHTVWRYRPDLEHDLPENGKIHPIESRIVTRQLGDSMVHEADGSWIHLLAEDIVGDLTWEVLWRHPGRAWQRLGARHETCCGCANREDGPRAVAAFPKADKGRRLEFLVRWRGAASIMLAYGPKPSSELGESTNIKSCQDCPFDPADNDYEYNDGSAWAADIATSCKPQN